MLLDPLPMAYGSTGVTYTGGTASNYRRTGIGTYVSTDGLHSADQQARLRIKTNPRIGGPSTFNIRFEKDLNVAPVNGVPQKDSTGVTTISYSGDLQHHNVSVIKSQIIAAAAVAIEFCDRIIAGES